MPTQRSFRYLDDVLSAAAAPCRTVLFVVAHFDDEVIGAGTGLMRWSPRTTLVHVTDGAPPDGDDARAAGFETPAAYSAARRRELAAALSCLPHPLQSLLTLGIPDRGATARLDDVIASLAAVVDRLAPAVLITHAYEGGHPDHDAVAFAARALQRISGLPGFELIEFASYHESRDGRLVTNEFAGDPSAIRCLTPAERRLKRLMLAQFATQARVLAPFTCDHESLRRARPVDFSQPPASGRVWFERLGWGITGAAWRAAVADVDRHFRSEGLRC